MSEERFHLYGEGQYVEICEYPTNCDKPECFCPMATCKEVYEALKMLRDSKCQLMDGFGGPEGFTRPRKLDRYKFIWERLSLFNRRNA